MALNILSNSGKTSYNVKELIADEFADLPLDGIAIGSLAYVVADEKHYMFNSLEQWIEVNIGSGGGGSGDMNIVPLAEGEYDPSTREPLIDNPQEKTIYLVPNPSGTSSDMWIEWIWMNGAWEKFGGASLDLEGYVKHTDTIEGEIDVKDPAPDWEENDENAIGYIKNKPFIVEQEQEEIFHLFGEIELPISLENDGGWAEYEINYKPDKAIEFSSFNTQLQIKINNIEYKMPLAEYEEMYISFANIEKNFYINVAINYYEYNKKAYIEISSSLEDEELVIEYAKLVNIKSLRNFNDDIIFGNKNGGISFNSSKAIANLSAAFGSASIAANSGAFAEGTMTEAYGETSHTEGYKTKTLEFATHAEGHTTVASGYSSHAEGNGTTASGDQSHAEGNGTTASDYATHAEGSGSTASGWFSHAEGSNTKATGESQHVQGKYNIEDNSSAHIVGWGDWSTKKNIHTLSNQGTAWFQGDVYVGSTGGKNRDAGSKKLATVDEVPKMVKLTQSQYDALTTKDSDTFYFIIGG